MNRENYLSEIFSETSLPVVYIDFDGTISKSDVIDRILETFADPRWLEIEEEWVAGRIGSRECLREQISLVRATDHELNELIDTVEIDEGLSALLGTCRDSGMDVHIISDGFENYIRRMLARSGLLTQFDSLKISANRLLPTGANTWRIEFPYYADVCTDGCATCKPAVMVRENDRSAPTIFIGDGLSDRFAAHKSDVVFAKSKLSDYCYENKISQTSYTNLRQVAESLDEAFVSFVTSLYRERHWQTTT